MSRIKGLDEAVRRHIKIPKRVQHQIDGARADLFYGPLSVRDAKDHGIKGWRGYDHAIGVIQDWIASDVPHELWYDNDFGGIYESLPEGEYVDGEWQEPFLENTFHVDRGEILRALLGSDLAGSL